MNPVDKRSNNILVTLLRVYAEEGYAVSVGLNQLRECPNGPFALVVPVAGLSGSHETVNGPKMKDDFVWRRVKVFLGRFPRATMVLRKIIPFWEENLSPSTYETSIHWYPLSGLGISLLEIYFFENVLKVFEPKRIFLIGIAAGWSTIAFGLINPSAVLYGIDNLSGGAQAEQGLELTKRIAKKLSMNLIIRVGSSPDDVPEFLNSVRERIDFVFVDGSHTNKQVLMDFLAVLPYVSNSVIMAFHDILTWNMVDGWSKIVEIASKENFKHRLLRRTSSGIGVLYRNVSKDVEDIIEAFYQDPSLIPPKTNLPMMVDINTSIPRGLYS